MHDHRNDPAVSRGEGLNHGKLGQRHGWRGDGRRNDDSDVQFKTVEDILIVRASVGALLRQNPTSYPMIGNVHLFVVPLGSILAGGKLVVDQLEV